MHLSGLSVPTKTLKPAYSFRGQVRHLLMICCYQSGCLIFRLYQNLASFWSKFLQLPWHPLSLKSLHPEHRHWDGRRNKMQSHQLRSKWCLTDRMKHFLRIALGGHGGPVSWLWCALNSGLIRMCCWEYVCMTAKQKGRLWLATGPVQRES